MAASNAQRFLTDNGGADDRALALKMFFLAVIEAFRSKTLLWNSIGGDNGVGAESAGNRIVSSKSVDSGKSWQFPIIGDDPTPQYHTPGTELLGMAVNLTEGTITIDDILVSHYDVPIDQIQLSHFDVIEPYAIKLGRSLAIDFDKKLFITGLKAARTAAVTGIHNGGNLVSRTAASVAAAYAVSSAGAGNYRDDVAELAQLMDEDNVPEEGRFLVITPYIRRVLSQDTTIFNKDFDDVTNKLNRRLIGILEGFMVMAPTNHFPTTALSGGLAKYEDDFAVGGAEEGEPAGLALAGAAEGSAAIGYVTAGGIQPHISPDERRNTKFMKAQMMVGAGVLAPWAAGAIHVHT